MTNRVQTIVRQAGIEKSLAFSRASGGQRNETWISDPYVVRFSLAHDEHALTREAALLDHLATKIPVPSVVAHGRDEEGEWMIQERVAGDSLAHAWPRLKEGRRRDAVEQLAEIIKTVHQAAADWLSPALLSATPPAPAPPILSLPNDWLTSALPAAVGQLAEQSKSIRYVDLGLMDEVLDSVQKLEGAPLTSGEWGIIHGDLHFDNVLWDGQRIAALLDFEKACYAPLDLELDLFLRYCSFPALFVAEEFEHLTRREDYCLVPTWFQQVYPQLFDSPFLDKRLALYSLHYDLKLLQRFPPRGEVDPNEDAHLLNRIRTAVARVG